MTGNYVIDRKTGKKIFETMPLCMSLNRLCTLSLLVQSSPDVRVGMHLLFCEGRELISYNRVEDLLKAQSIRREYFSCFKESSLTVTSSRSCRGQTV